MSSQEKINALFDKVKMFNFNSHLFGETLRFYGLSIYLFLLGSHLFYPSYLAFIILGLFLIKFKHLFSFSVLFLLLALISLYGVYIYNHQAILHNSTWASRVASEISMILIVYFAGLSIEFKSLLPNTRISERGIFYLLYGFFIAYAIGIAYSYFYFSQNDILSQDGFWVFYKTNGIWGYHADGSLAVTVVAYFLSFVIAFIPFMLLNFNIFRERNFRYTEILLLFGLGIFSFYLAAGMGRRLILLTTAVLFLYFISGFIVRIYRKFEMRHLLFLLVFVAIIASVGHYIVSDTLLGYRLGIKGFSDYRMHHWLSGLRYIWEYPWGEADRLPVNILKGDPHEGDPHAHNMWIDIGKSFGIAAFISWVLFYLIHLKYLMRIFRNRKVEPFIKNSIFIITFVLFANMMVESIFHVEKTFFFYSIFFLGFLKSYSDSFET